MQANMRENDRRINVRRMIGQNQNRSLQLLQLLYIVERYAVSHFEEYPNREPKQTIDYGRHGALVDGLRKVNYYGENGPE